MSQNGEAENMGLKIYVFIVRAKGPAFTDERYHGLQQKLFTDPGKGTGEDNYWRYNYTVSRSQQIHDTSPDG